jgi:hypothetical protein
MRIEVAGMVKAVGAKLFEWGDVSLDDSQNWSTSSQLISDFQSYSTSSTMQSAYMLPKLPHVFEINFDEVSVDLFEAH